jgi:urease accessory protein
MPNTQKIEMLAFQLADSAFPSGSFAHSGGIEAASNWGELRSLEDLKDYLETVIRQAPFGTLPLLVAAYRKTDSFAEIDQLCNAVLSNHVARRSSSVQGRALLATASRVFDSPAISQLRQQTREQDVPAHLAPVFGVLACHLEIPLDKALQIFLYTLLRDLVSAAVRLNIIGPHAGQRLIVELSTELQQAVERSGELELEDIAQTAPLVEILQVNHDRLYSRLFQS